MEASATHFSWRVVSLLSSTHPHFISPSRVREGESEGVGFVISGLVICRKTMKIIQERKKCIGCASCAAVCPKYFEMGSDGLASIIGGQPNGENMELEIQEAGCAQEASEICPVQIIQIQ